MQDRRQGSKIHSSLNWDGETRWQICRLYNLQRTDWASGLRETDRALRPGEVLSKKRTQWSCIWTTGRALRGEDARFGPRGHRKCSTVEGWCCWTDQKDMSASSWANQIGVDGVRTNQSRLESGVIGCPALKTGWKQGCRADDNNNNQPIWKLCVVFKISLLTIIWAFPFENFMFAFKELSLVSETPDPKIKFHSNEREKCSSKFNQIPRKKITH